MVSILSSKLNSVDLSPGRGYCADLSRLAKKCQPARLGLVDFPFRLMDLTCYSVDGHVSCFDFFVKFKARKVTEGKLENPFLLAVFFASLSLLPSVKISRKE